MSPLSFKDWRLWVASLPWTLRWFIFLVLVRPVMDVLYFLKDVSPLLSPLYIAGVATPLLIIWSLLSSSTRRRGNSSLDALFLVLIVFVGLNCVFLLATEVSLYVFEILLKIITPFLLFFFLRLLVSSKADLVGVLTTFLYSAIFPLSMLMYEQFVGPISPVVHTRGFDRFEGLYADVMSYAIYVIGVFVIACYFFLDPDNREAFGRRAMRFAVVGSVTILGLFSMHHTASWGVAAGMLGLMLLSSIQLQKLAVPVFLIMLGGAGYLIVGQAIQERLEVALASDIQVLEGEKDTDRAFHGRMWRWNKYIDEWKEKTILDKALGVAFSAKSPPGSWVLTGVHSDYLRMVFSAGILGLIVYMLVHLNLAVVSFSVGAADSFLIRASSAVLLLYSITTTPTLYISLMYLIVTVFAFAALPSAASVGHRARSPQRVARVPSELGHRHVARKNVY